MAKTLTQRANELYELICAMWEEGYRIVVQSNGYLDLADDEFRTPVCEVEVEQ